MRTGTNPAKVNNYKVGFPAVLGAVITHLPHQRDYHAQRMEIIQICLTTMRAAGIPVLVWDNGSCPELRHWLSDIYRPEYLVLSRNVGKAFAKASIFNMLPPQTMVAFSDDDMLYYPHWLEAHQDIFGTFPSVGAVSGWPVRVSHNWGNANTVTWAAKHATIERGRFISENEERQYCLSVGINFSDHDKRKDLEDIRITYHGRQVYAAAQHCQFYARAGTIAPFCEYAQHTINPERGFDIAIDAAGLLRLTTTTRYTFHMGNVIDDDLREEIGRANG